MTNRSTVVIINRVVKFKMSKLGIVEGDFRELQSFVLQSYDNDSDHVMCTAEKRDMKGNEL